MPWVAKEYPLANTRRPTITKRLRERSRQERRKQKEEKRAVRNAEKEERPASEVGEEDPDIAGIIPGPQPLPEDY